MNEEMYLLFENFLDGQLSNEERLDFEEKLKKDLEFQNDFEMYKETSAYLKNKFDSDTIAFKQSLKSISKNHDLDAQKKEIKIFPTYTWYYVAASIVVLLGFWFFMQNGNPQYSDYSTHETAAFVERAEANPDIKMAEVAFNSKNYKEACVYLEKILKNNPSPEFQYFYAISLLEQNQFLKAETQLDTLKRSNTIYKEKAIWYLALSKLKQEKWDECKSYLNQIPETSEDYEKAQELLEKL
jgi:tetratricopeptide (TPR) repeat protein